MPVINRSSGDNKVKVSLDDLNSGQLIDKLVAGAGVTLNILTAGDGTQTLEITTSPFEPDQFGLHMVKCRVDDNGCKINLEVSQLADQSLCGIRKVSC